MYYFLVLYCTRYFIDLFSLLLGVIVVNYFRFIILFLFIIMITSCLRLNSDKIPELIIENGTYQNNDSTCTISFDYYVTEEKCLVGGWSVDWQTGSMGVTNWFFMQTLIPGKRYTIQQTFYHISSLPPIVKMYGYPLDNNDSFELLEACDTLNLVF